MLYLSTLYFLYDYMSDFVILYTLAGQEFCKEVFIGCFIFGYEKVKYNLFQN